MVSEQHPGRTKSCICFDAPSDRLVIVKELGMDKRYGEASLLTCPECSQAWLRYFYEIEAFTASGSWFLGAVTAEQVSRLTGQNAKETLEGSDWYFFGGSYFLGQSGRSSGVILL